MIPAARIDALAAALHADGWCHCAALLPAPLTAALREDLLARRAQFAPAAVGRGGERQQAARERSDSTLWLSGASAAQREFLALAESLREALNRRLYLGLADYEAHYAHYAPGQFYRRHVDAFRQHVPGPLPQRLLSSVFYLSDAAAGGELLIWRGDAEIARIAPAAGAAVFFLSADFPHAVLPAAVDRYSIAGWYRGRGA